MKKFLFLALAAFLSFSVFAAPAALNPTKPKSPNAADVMIPIGKDGQQVSLLHLSKMSVKEVEEITGKKMKLADKLGFKVAQRQLKSNINEDGTLNNRKIAKQAKRAADGSGFHLGGFALGFLLGLIGVLIAYLIKDELKSQRTKWAWIGLGAAVLLYIILLLL